MEISCRQDIAAESENNCQGLVLNAEPPNRVKGPMLSWGACPARSCCIICIGIEPRGTSAICLGDLACLH